MGKTTPSQILEVALKIAGVTKNDVLLDMGSRDGRIAHLATIFTGCRSVGVELDPEFADKSKKHTKTLGLTDKVSIIHGDLLDVDLTPFSVIYVFQSGGLLKKISKKLRKEAKHAKIIAFDYPLCKMTSAKTVDVPVIKGHRPRRLYFYGEGF